MIPFPVVIEAKTYLVSSWTVIFCLKQYGWGVCKLIPTQKY